VGTEPALMVSEKKYQEIPPVVVATPAGFETGPEDRTKSKRCADLQNDRRALRRDDGVAREPLRASGFLRNSFKWAPSGPEKVATLSNQRCLGQ
jgi:hypothetical protein